MIYSFKWGGDKHKYLIKLLQITGPDFDRKRKENKINMQYYKY